MDWARCVCWKVGICRWSKKGLCSGWEVRSWDNLEVIAWTLFFSVLSSQYRTNQHRKPSMNICWMNRWKWTKFTDFLKTPLKNSIRLGNKSRQHYIYGEPLPKLSFVNWFLELQTPFHMVVGNSGQPPKICRKLVQRIEAVFLWKKAS